MDPETIRTVGLISLQQRIPQIWQDLFDLARDWVSEEQWQSFRAQVETQDHHESSVRFRNRMHNVFDGGPHAVLIRDAIADHARFDGVDYLSAPETIEDLCESFKIHNQRDLLGKFQTESVPCIVKFQDQCRRDDLVGVALSYLWCTSHGEPCLTCNACLEGDRNTIPADAIIEVERIDERR
ncbi:hypothetical protein [Nitrospira sp. KM1]|uniref:hypothetical protein n=1 Tax=Nitrospira sp. KM1 TaxID=1936990 RepID=UPI0015637956|nr:hypothetical protein [Nitrospira sp. KM1]